MSWAAPDPCVGPGRRSARRAAARNVLLRLWLLLALLGWSLAAAWLPAGATAPHQSITPSPSAPAAANAKAAAVPPMVKAIMDHMSPADRVGQLFLVTFEGTDVSATSDIAILVRDYRVGGVVLRPANGNFRSAAAASPITATIAATATEPTLLTTPQQIALLSNALQALAMMPPRALTETTAAAITPTAGIAPTATPGATLIPTVTPAAALTPTTIITATQPLTHTGIPLLIGLEWDGDDSSIFAGGNGFSPLPAAMAMGATWTPSLAEAAGQTLGKELQAVGVNLLLGPPLDVLDTPRPGSKGDLDTRAFGGDPYWVGQMGQ
ncbi:MAG: glycoside hydrolase family 3 N-terminal domain-containing protein, partial [Anaerolineae bacterium]